MRTLAPQRLQATYWRSMERQVRRVLYEIIFAPLVMAINGVGNETETQIRLVNATRSPLIMALSRGRVQYVNGAFTGSFSASISGELKRLGATYDAKRRAWLLGSFHVPAAVKMEAAAYQTKARLLHLELKAQLAKIQAGLEKMVSEARLDAEPVVDSIDGGFKAAARQLEVSPTLSEESKARLASDYTENMKLYIKKFSAEQIVNLRDAVEKNATEGYRSETLIAAIKKRYGVTARHAKFLARNETSIFMSKYHQERYGEAGITHYIWSTSHDARVRPALGTTDYGDNHRRLDGRTFAFANPPIVDTAKGRKANPGEDYNCRCIAIPILSSTAAGRAREREDYNELVERTDYSRVRA